MKTEILYKHAVAESGELVHVEEAEKGGKYFCPGCKNEFLLKKSGKTGKGSRQTHFAHKELSPNCTGEGYLHKTFKKLVVALFEKVKSEQKPFLIRWNCSSCKCSNVGSLFHNATSIREEHNLKVCRPDIALLDKDEKIFAAIEIVVKHAPEENVLQYYRENEIALIQINVKDEDDLNKYEEKINAPDIVDFCFSSSCPNNSRYNMKRHFVWKSFPCNAKLHPVLNCTVVIDSAFGRYENNDFTNEEIQRINQSNTNVRFQNSNNVKKAFFYCQHCEAQQLMNAGMLQVMNTRMPQSREQKQKQKIIRAFYNPYKRS